MTEMALWFDRVAMVLTGSRFRLDLNVRIEAGTCVILVGPSRSGKSAAMELAAGVASPESGRVVMLGYDWAQLEEEARILLRSRVGVVLQQPGLLSNMTLFNNVALPLRYHRPSMAEGERERLVMSHLERLGVAESLDRFPADLNQGEVRRGAVARAMVLGPEVLVLDDPVAGLDAEAVLRLRTYVNQERAVRSLPVVAALRGYSPFMEEADRLLLLCDGLVEADGPQVKVASEVSDRFQSYVQESLARESGSELKG